MKSRCFWLRWWFSKLQNGGHITLLVERKQSYSGFWSCCSCTKQRFLSHFCNTNRGNLFYNLNSSNCHYCGFCVYNLQTTWRVSTRKLTMIFQIQLMHQQSLIWDGCRIRQSFTTIKLYLYNLVNPMSPLLILRLFYLFDNVNDNLPL